MYKLEGIYSANCTCAPPPARAYRSGHLPALPHRATQRIARHGRYTDVQSCINLLDDKRQGVFALLDEECRLPKGTDLSFVRKLDSLHSELLRWPPRCNMVLRVATPRTSCCNASTTRCTAVCTAGTTRCRAPMPSRPREKGLSKDRAFVVRHYAAEVRGAACARRREEAPRSAE